MVLKFSADEWINRLRSQTLPRLSSSPKLLGHQYLVERYAKKVATLCWFPSPTSGQAEPRVKHRLTEF